MPMKKKMNKEEFFKAVGKILEKESRLIQLPAQGKAVFVGDTHGDLEASEEVVRRYLRKPYRIVFLGDYVDRGDRSEENIHFLLRMKLEHPNEIFLLAGNHEGYMAKEFYPVSFWSSLPAEEKELYGLLFSKLPLAATSPNGVLALHGGLPELGSLDEINRINWGDESWNQILWGDFVERDVDVMDDWGGRPQYGGEYFRRMMERFQRQVLIRSHQPHASLLMFEKRCITVLTSHAYLPIRTIVIADLGKEIRSAEDLEFERI